MALDSNNDGNAETPLAFRVVRGGIWVAFSQYWTIGFGFVATIILTRLLAPEIFGQFAYAQFFAGLVTLSPKLGLRYGFIQHPDTNAETVGTYLGLELLATIASFVIILVLAPILPQSVALICIVLLGAEILAKGGLGAVLLEKDLHLGLTSRLFSITFPLSYIPSFIFALSGYGIWSLVVQVVFNNLLHSIVYLWIFRYRLHRIPKTLQKFNRALGVKFLKAGSPAGLSDFTFGLTRSMDSFFIGTFVNATALGYYDRARRISYWPSTLFINMISRTSLYTYARLQDDQIRLRKAIEIVSWSILLLSIPLSLLIFFTTPMLIQILYGDAWLPSIPYLRIFAISLIGVPMIENFNTYLIATGQTQLVLRLTILQIAIVVVLGLSLTLMWGAIGTAVAMVIAAFVRGGAMSYIVSKRLPGILHPIFKGLLPAGVLTMLGVVIFDNYLNPNIYNQMVVIQFIYRSVLILGLYTLFVTLFQGRLLKQHLTYVWSLTRGLERR